MLATLGAILGVVLALCALAGIAWRWVILPNLREQLLEPVQASKRQLTENRHRNREPTILDRLDDIESHVDVVGLNLLAVLRRLGASEREHERLWLIVESLIHESDHRGERHDPPGT